MSYGPYEIGIVVKDGAVATYRMYADSVSFNCYQQTYEICSGKEIIWIVARERLAFIELPRPGKD